MWSLGLIWGMALLAVIVAVCVPIIVITRSRGWKENTWEGERLSDAGYLGVSAAVILVVSLVIGAGVSFPYSKEYHYYEVKDGVVVVKDAHLMSKSEGMEERYIIGFEGTGNDYRCEDSRCVSVQPGDYLKLRCIRVWEYPATDGYSCQFIEWQPSDGD